MTTTRQRSVAVARPSRREWRKQQTRVALERAALRLFAERGYERTTVEEIAAAAGVGLRTFFRYFSSKRHVLFGDIAHSRVDALRAALDARPAAEPPLESVRAVLDLLDVAGPAEEEQILLRLRLMERQPSLRGAYLALTDELRRVVAEFVARRAGLAAAHPYPLLVAAAATASWETAVSAWAAADGHGPLTALRHQAWAALTAGIPGNPPPADGQPASRSVAR